MRLPALAALAFLLSSSASAQSLEDFYGQAQATLRSPAPMPSIEGLPPDRRRCRDDVTLRHAAEIGCRRQVRELLRQGADPNQEDSATWPGQKSAAVYAAHWGHVELLEDLLSAGGDPNGKGAPLYSAIEGGQHEAAMLLLSRNAIAGKWEMIEAAIQGLDEVLVAILENPRFQLEPDFENPGEGSKPFWYSGYSAIHYVARWPATVPLKAKALALLLKRGASVNRQLQSRSSLSGADIGKTALDLAMVQGPQEAVDVLRAAGGVFGRELPTP